MDLFSPVAPQSRLHPNFINVSSIKEYAPERAVIQSWADGFPDRDNKFVFEFQTTFNSCFWELYVHACLIQLGLPINWAYPSPDFLITDSLHPFVGEATIASHADGYLAEWERSYDDASTIDRHEMLRTASLRLSSALSGKLLAYKERYASLNHVRGKPFVVFLGAYDQPFFFLQHDNAIRRVLYGLEQPLWIMCRTTGKRVCVGESYRPVESKDSGASVEFGLFTDQRCKEISAVVFSSTATFGKVNALASSQVPAVFTVNRYNAYGPEATHVTEKRGDYSETLLDGLHVFVNPHASIPIYRSMWDRPDIAIHALDAPTGEYSCTISHGHLLARICTIPLPPTGTARNPLQPEPGKKAQHVRKAWPEGRLVSVPGNVLSFSDTHIAHYRGWTIAVAYCTIDSDWGWQAHTGAARSIPEYIELNQSDEGTARICSAWFESKEAALADAQKEIDDLLNKKDAEI